MYKVKFSWLNDEIQGQGKGQKVIVSKIAPM